MTELTDQTNSRRSHPILLVALRIIWLALTGVMLAIGGLNSNRNWKSWVLPTFPLCAPHAALERLGAGRPFSPAIAGS